MEFTSGIVWFRSDLRLSDNLALWNACKKAQFVIPVYIYSPQEEGAWPPGAASRWWLHYSLEALRESLKEQGVELILRKGPVLENLLDIARQSGARSISWNKRFEPAARQLEASLEKALQSAGIVTSAFNSTTLIEPDEIFTDTGQAYKIFTPFFKALSQFEVPVPAFRPGLRPCKEKTIEGCSLDELELLPRVDWADGLRQAWRPGEAGAWAQVERFQSSALNYYASGRDRPDKELVSRLSPHLHFGEISLRVLWSQINQLMAADARLYSSASVYLRELAWREFANYLLFHFPETELQSLRSEFAHFPWQTKERLLKLWQKGRTGYPIVDAGMRELWHTGWMHNRVRMIVASFLVKDLLMPWQEGARWFWDTLVDADLANNTLGWQWTAGCGADAAPYFRIFNPTLQGEKFDPEGNYVRKWVPELGRLPKHLIHKPWEASLLELSDCEVELGRNYPYPVIEHPTARRRALAAFESIKRKSPL